MPGPKNSPVRAAAAAAISALALALAPAAAQGKVYFTAFLGSGGTGLERAGFDGAAMQTLQFEPAGFDDGVALDTADGRVYWTDTFASVIFSADMNGTDPQIVLDDFGQEPYGIALDVAGGKMYWTDREGVKRASLSGGERETLTTEPARGFIALDLAERRMYWADEGGTIRGAAMEVNPTISDVVTKQATPFGVAVDEAAHQLYWVSLGKIKKGEGTKTGEVIRRADVDGSGAETIVERPGAGFEGGIAVDPAAGRLYWTEAEAHDVGVANLDGSEARTLFSTGTDSPEGLAIDTSDAHPTATAAPSIEGDAQVGGVLFCDPGAWSGTGPITFGYQWEIAGLPLAGASSEIYVPSSEDAGGAVSCTVTATDDVDTSAATSSPVLVADLPDAGGPPPAGVVETRIIRSRLIAAFAFSRLTSSLTTAPVPVFASLPGTATVKATPVGGAGGSGHGARSRRRGRARSKAASQRRPKTVTATRRLRAGRGTVTLKKLRAGTRYRLSLIFKSTDGQSASDTATLKVRRR
jgi:DNA-binding beta-propeller fold protein YncE